MTDCGVSAHNIDIFLITTPKLRSFKWIHTGFGSGAAYNWNGGAFLRAIINHLGDTLEELSLTVAPGFVSWTALGSLRGFQRLWKLELSTRLSLGEEDDGIDDTILFEEGNWEGRTVADLTRSSGPKLYPKLPSSLKQLRLLFEFDKE